MNLSHPSVLQFVGVADDVFHGPAICMVLPWMDNGSIRQYRHRLHARGQLDGQTLTGGHVNQWVSGDELRQARVAVLLERDILTTM